MKSEAASQQRAQVANSMATSTTHKQQLGRFKTIAVTLNAATRVAYLSLCRPDKSNSFDEEMWSELPQVSPPPPPPPRPRACSVAGTAHSLPGHLIDVLLCHSLLLLMLTGSRHVEQPRRGPCGELR